MSFGPIPGAHQLQLGPLGADTVLSTVVHPVHDAVRRERTGGETSPDALRERTPYNECDIAHVPSGYLMDEGEEEKEEGEDLRKAKGTEAELSQQWESSPPGILKKRIQETSRETDSQNLTAEVCGCAHSNGSPICGFVKATQTTKAIRMTTPAARRLVGIAATRNPVATRNQRLASVSIDKHKRKRKLGKEILRILHTLDTRSGELPIAAAAAAINSACPKALDSRRF